MAKGGVEWGSLVSQKIDVWRTRRSHRQLEQILEKTDLDEEALAARMEADDATSALIEEALEAGARTHRDEKRRLLAGVVAEALEGGTPPTDHDHQLLRTVSELEPADVHYLARFRQTAQDYAKTRLEAQEVEGWPGESLLIAPTAAALVRAGVLAVQPGGGYSGGGLILTAYGDLFLDWLTEDPDGAHYFAPPS